MEPLERELREAIRGEVRFDAGSRALYSADGSIYRQVPIGVVLPRDVDDAVQAVAIAREHGVPVLPRGGGTSLEGQCVNAALVLDFSKYVNHVLCVDPRQRTGQVEPGAVCDQLRAGARPHGLTFAPDPATHNHSTMGGQAGNNSCGVHSVMGGRTSDNVQELEVLTYDGLRLRVGPTSDDELEAIIGAGGRRGDIYRRLRDLRDRYADLVRERFPRIPRRVSGYNLDELLPENGFNVARALCGTEGTCVTVLGATMRLIDWPAERALLVIGYPDAYHAADHVCEIMEHHPCGLEAFDGRMVEGMKKKGLEVDALKLLPDAGGWLLAEFGAGTAGEAEDRARELMQRLGRNGDWPHMKVFRGDAQSGDAKAIWGVRESAVGAVSDVPGEPLVWPAWEDAAVAPEKLGPYLREFRDLCGKHEYDVSLFGHFGQGCVHVRIPFELQTAQGIKDFRRFMEEAADLVCSYGGSLSGEHGDGQAHAELLPKMFGHELVQAFNEFKAIWDPDNKMNPGKLVHPYRMDQNLRLGTDYKPKHPATYFGYPDDRGSFARSQLRCIGVGKCRRHEGGTMCPSYMVTGEEMHSTRGRARLLFEMILADGERPDMTVTDGWRSEEVKQALDLCLACKGCKGDCPVQVDMATYKAEFLAHYYKGRLRPRSAYAMGLIYWWARLASKAPGLVNLVAHMPLLASVTKSLAGVDRRRQMPRFAAETFRDWWRRRGEAQAAHGQRVILWADTFNNHFHPDTARAAVEVLESAGCRVAVPEQSLCCGRPLYDYGFLPLAKRLLEQNLAALKDDIRAGTPVVVLEPSCLAVFRDELPGMFPFDEDARRLSEQSFLLGEFLMTRLPGYTLPKLERRAVVHGHCHQKAIVTMKHDQELMSRMGLHFEVLDSGCCGMAGSFGFEAGEHYEVSQKCGERVLFPAVEQAGDETLIVADGFSCREQIAQGTSRRALHLAQVLRLALRQPSGPVIREDVAAEPDWRKAGAVAAGVGLAVAGGAALRRRMNGRS
ncbi:MAG TPA: FAD-linked oxidase C-terminal domain-containing protein [Chloroflexota bacterium]|nr:FAD-linked oxidase C-terminal domain-containing protein [Chloroflexota bacterium]